jgi:hypothetical protein
MNLGIPFRLVSRFAFRVTGFEPGFEVMILIPLTHNAQLVTLQTVLEYCKSLMIADSGKESEVIQWILMKKILPVL